MPGWKRTNLQGNALIMKGDDDSNNLQLTTVSPSRTTISEFGAAWLEKRCFSHNLLHYVDSLTLCHAFPCPGLKDLVGQGVLAHDELVRSHVVDGRDPGPATDAQPPARLVKVAVLDPELETQEGRLHRGGRRRGLGVGETPDHSVIGLKKPRVLEFLLVTFSTLSSYLFSIDVPCQPRRRSRLAR